MVCSGGSPVWISSGNFRSGDTELRQQRVSFQRSHNGMKILMIFIDMLRPGLLHVVDPSKERGPLDDQFEKIGGTLYRNCFTPGPDSARSLACLWSGKYPYKNGCDRRIKYPGFFLKNDSKNILEVLREQGFELYFFNNFNESRNGILPPGSSSRGMHNKDLNVGAFLRDSTLADQSFVFLSVSDFHWNFDDFDFYPFFVKRGHRKVASVLQIIQENINIDDFDHLFIFSDHGFKLRRELKHEPAYKLLDRARTNTFLLHRHKTDTTLSYNDKFCSMMDFYPTLCEIIGAFTPADLDGISLFSERERQLLVAEDHTDFAPRVNQTIDLWAIIKKGGVYYRDLRNHYFDHQDAFSESPRELDDIIAHHSPLFFEQVKEGEVVAYYRNMVLEKSFYIDGSRRVSVVSNLKRIARRLLKPV